MLAGPDLLVILAIALVVFGPKRLPELARTIGKMMGEFKKTTEEIKEGIGIKGLEEMRSNLTGMDLFVDLANKTSEYMEPSDNTKDASPPKEKTVSDQTLSLAPGSAGNAGKNEKLGSERDG